MSGELRARLRGSMEPPLAEEEVQRIWRSIGVRRTLSRRRAPRALTTGFAFAAALVVFMVWASPRLNSWAGAGPLVLAGGAKIGLLQAIITASINRPSGEGAVDAREPAAREPPARDAPAISSAKTGPVSRARERPRTLAFRELAQRGDYKGAYQALGEAGFQREAAAQDVETLLLLADIARLSGHPEGAVSALSRVVREHPSDPRASLSAFTLGRLELDSLGLPARAAASFKSALDLGLEAALVEDARASLVEAFARAGECARAREAAIDYELRFPNGRRKQGVRRWAACE